MMGEYFESLKEITLYTYQSLANNCRFHPVAFFYQLLGRRLFMASGGFAGRLLTARSNEIGKSS
jgi:hypothetical protein